MGSSWSPASAKQPELCEPGLRRAQLRQLLGQRWLLATCNTVSMGERTLIRTLRLRDRKNAAGQQDPVVPHMPFDAGHSSLREKRKRQCGKRRGRGEVARDKKGFEPRKAASVSSHCPASDGARPSSRIRVEAPAASAADSPGSEPRSRQRENRVRPWAGAVYTAPAGTGDSQVLPQITRFGGFFLPGQTLTHPVSWNPECIILPEPRQLRLGHRFYSKESRATHNILEFLQAGYTG